MERFSRLEQAVEAVDFEVDRLGPSARRSAGAGRALASLASLGGGQTHHGGEALRLSAWRRFHGRG
jgi:hypothetical protein